MPKRINPKVKERCVQQMLEHAAEYPNPTAAADVVGKRNGVGGETVRRWYLQAQVDSSQRRGATSEESDPAPGHHENRCSATTFQKLIPTLAR